MERKVLDPREAELRLTDEFNAVLNMIGEGAPDYAADEKDEIPNERQRDNEKAKDLN